MRNNKEALKLGTVIRFFFLPIVVMIFAVEAVASEYLRLTVDLDGDGKSEVVTASTSGENDIQKYTVRVKGSIYDGEYFAAEGDLPQITTTRINYNSGIKQLLITTMGPASCDYDLLSFSQGKLISLMRTSSHDCNAPKPLGNGKVEVLKWEGFWYRHEKYELDPQGTKLTQETQALYAVGVPGVATGLLSMQPFNCRSASIPKGAFVVVSQYDIENKRYLIKSLANSCGWVPQKEIFNAVGELPWAN